MSMRTASARSTREMGLIKYFATPALSALVFHVPNVVAVSTTMGMPDVAGSCLSIIYRPPRSYLEGINLLLWNRVARVKTVVMFAKIDLACRYRSIFARMTDRPFWLLDVWKKPG